MNKYLCLAFLSFFFLSTGCSSGDQQAVVRKRKPPVEVGPGEFKLRILQDSEVVRIQNDRCVLKPEDFIVELSLNGLSEVYASACLFANLEGQLKGEALRTIPAKVMTGSPKNEDHEVIINCQGYNHWRLQNGANYSFNRLDDYGSIKVGKLMVSNFYFAESEEILDVNEMTDPVHLQIFSMEHPGTDSIQIKQIQTLKIDWL